MWTLQCRTARMSDDVEEMHHSARKNQQLSNTRREREGEGEKAIIVWFEKRGKKEREREYSAWWSNGSYLNCWTSSIRPSPSIDSNARFARRRGSLERLISIRLILYLITSDRWVSNMFILAKSINETHRLTLKNRCVYGRRVSTRNRSSFPRLTFVGSSADLIFESARLICAAAFSMCVQGIRFDHVRSARLMGHVRPIRSAIVFRQ